MFYPECFEESKDKRITAKPPKEILYIQVDNNKTFPVGKQECGRNSGKVLKNVTHPLYAEYLKEVLHVNKKYGVPNVMR
jgi:hypothetical protein